MLEDFVRSDRVLKRLGSSPIFDALPDRFGSLFSAAFCSIPEALATPAPGGGSRARR